MDNITVRKEAPSAPASDNNKKPKQAMKWGVTGITIVAVIGLIAAGYFYWQYQEVKKDPTAALEDRNADETNRVLTKLRTVIQINETDQPTVARVDDPGKLKEANQEFYANVQQGDYLVLYPKRAIIFRESNNQIVNVAPIINTSELNTTNQQTTEEDTNE